MADAESMLLLGEQLLDRRVLRDALHCFNAAERMGAEADRCAAGRWMIFMLQGRFPCAWKESDSIRQRGKPDPHRFWNGEHIDGKRVIVRCLHGLGDSVQFLRYIPLLRNHASCVIVEVPPQMRDLAECIAGIDEVISWGEEAPAKPPKWDVQVEVTELPYLFRTEVQHLPIAKHYLRLPRHLVEQASDALRTGTGFNVGVVWSSGEWNPTRSIPFQKLRPLFEQSSCTFWNLQGGRVREQWNEAADLHNLQDAREWCNDTGPLKLAAFIAQLDLVLTVDSLAAHLAGALGCPAWVMLQRAADWRWMEEREDSPWYPSLRLFRQRKQGDWGSAIEQVQHALANHTTLARGHRAVA